MSGQTNMQVSPADGLVRLVIENEQLRAEFLPEIGGKMITLVNKKTGRQFLLPPQNAEGTYRRPAYGDRFDDYDTSGFDECFPTVAPSEYEIKKEHGKRERISLPDHGELWCTAWTYTQSDGKIVMAAQGRRLDYRFEKTVHLHGDSVVIDYTLHNTGKIPFHYLWSAHPLLNIEPGVKIFFEDNIQWVFLHWASGQQISQLGRRLPWPIISMKGQTIDLSIAPPKTVGVALKCFTEVLSEGVAGLFYPESNESILFRFDPRINPYLGLWLCYGGWPEDSPHKHYTVALEPTSGRPDALSAAIARNECSLIGAGEIRTWSLTIQVISGKPNFAKST